MSQPDITAVLVDGTSVQPSKTGTVSYMRKNDRPAFTWTAHDPDGDPLTFSISCWWYGRRSGSGDPNIEPVLQFTRTGLTAARYRPKEDEKLQYCDPDDVGGDYYVEITANDGVDETVSGGYFRINQPPNIPTGLMVS